MNRNKRLLRNLLSVGLDSGLAQKVLAAGFTLTKLRQANKKELAQHFDSPEVEQIWEVVKRKRIPSETVQRLVEGCDWKCCVCWNYRKEDPVIIHHIEEHSKTHDDNYDNLVVLCLNHHAMAHSKWEISQPPLPPELLRSKKREWVKAVSDFKAGRRPAPGDEQYPGEPELKLSTEIDFSPPTSSEEAIGWKRSWFVKLKVENKGRVVAKNCFGRLLKATDEQGKQLIGLGALNLYWTRQDSPESHEKLDIQGNGDFNYLDIAQVKEAEDILTLRVVVPRGHRLAVPPGSTRRSEDLPPGTYYVCIGVYADNVSLNPEWYKIRWEANYSVPQPCSIVSEVPPSEA